MLKIINRLIVKKRGKLALCIAMTLMAQMLLTAGASAAKERVQGDVSEGSVSADRGESTLPGNGTRDEPYLIRSSEDWSVFCDELDNGIDDCFSDKYLKLTGSIEIDRMASGSENRAFCGHFDGDGNYLHLDYSFDTDAETVSECAPFRYTGGNASIRNLITDGEIVTKGVNAAGLVGAFNGSEGGSLTIENCIVKCRIDTRSRHAGGLIGYTGGITIITGCTSSVLIVSRLEGDGGHGGLAGCAGSDAATDIRIKDSVFNGRFIGNDTSGWSGLVGGDKGDFEGRVTLDNAVFAPVRVSVSDKDSSTLYRMDRGVSLNEIYCTQELGRSQGGVRVADSMTARCLFRVIAVNGLDYYEPCEITGLKDVYECVLVGEPVDLGISVSDNRGFYLKEGEDYFVKVEDDEGKRIGQIDRPGYYNVSVEGNPSKGYLNYYNRRIIVDFDPGSRPVITAQPEPLILEYGYDKGNAFRVSAEYEGDSFITYQWYKNEVPGISGGIKVEGAREPVLELEPGMDAGRYYYYCEITAERKVSGIKIFAYSDLAALKIEKRRVTVTACDQTVSRDSAIRTGSENAVLKGAPEGHELSSISFRALLSEGISGNGVIIPYDAVIMCAGEDKTSNYDIEYISGRLSVLNPEPEPEPAVPVPQVDDNMIHVRLETGIEDEKGGFIVVDMSYQKSVFYNGRRHEAYGMSKAGKSVAADLRVKTEKILDGKAAPVLRFRDNISSMSKNGKVPCFTLCYRPVKGADKDTKKLIKLVNEYLKDKSFAFEIVRTDLKTVRVTEFKTRKDKVVKLYVEVGGVKVKLSKKDYEAKLNSDGSFTLTGRNNFTGTLKLPRQQVRQGNTKALVDARISRRLVHLLSKGTIYKEA